MKKSFTMRNVPEEERPRERAQKFGIEALSVQELLELIIGRGNKGEPVADMAGDLLKQFGGLEGMEKASLGELTQMKGIGIARAAQIKAAFELANRLESKSRIGQRLRKGLPEKKNR